MKKSLFTTALGICFILISHISIYAQQTASFNYQTVVRDNNGTVIANEAMNVEIRILNGSAEGDEVYKENHDKTTNNYGLINLEVGNGTSGDDFSTINWSEGDFFIEISINENLIGTSQLLSVPFAKYAEKAGSIEIEEIEGIAPLRDSIRHLSNILIQVSPVDRLLNFGYLPGDLYAAGVPFIELYNEGIEIDTLRSMGITIEAMLDEGITIDSMLAEKVPMADILDAGVTYNELFGAGGNFTDLHAETGVTVSTLSDSGVLVGTLGHAGVFYDSLANNDLMGTLTDFDGNTYYWVKVGDQKWMADNLVSTHYADGSPIDSCIWFGQNTDYATNPDADLNGDYTIDELDSIIYVSNFGFLYNWETIMNGSASSNTIPSGVQGICPDGWHLPSDAEIAVLDTVLGFENEDLTAVNEFGEVFLPDGRTGLNIRSGNRFIDNAVWIYSFNPIIWTTTQNPDNSIEGRVLFQFMNNGPFSYLRGGIAKNSAGAVRCIKN
jgi:uncharacterized protein (TIGR02145 family)